VMNLSKEFQNFLETKVLLKYYINKPFCKKTMHLEKVCILG
jgi:hypothetical protein